MSRSPSRSGLSPVQRSRVAAAAFDLDLGGAVRLRLVHEVGARHDLLDDGVHEGAPVVAPRGGDELSRTNAFRGHLISAVPDKWRDGLPGALDAVRRLTQAIDTHIRVGTGE